MKAHILLGPSPPKYLAAADNRSRPHVRVHDLSYREEKASARPEHEADRLLLTSSQGKASCLPTKTNPSEHSDGLRDDNDAWPRQGHHPFPRHGWELPGRSPQRVEADQCAAVPAHRTPPTIRSATAAHQRPAVRKPDCSRIINDGETLRRTAVPQTVRGRRRCAFFFLEN